MPGMMRSRKSGCMCRDCAGPRVADRASDKRGWYRRETRGWGNDPEQPLPWLLPLDWTW